MIFMQDNCKMRSVIQTFITWKLSGSADFATRTSINAECSFPTSTELITESSASSNIKIAFFTPGSLHFQQLIPSGFNKVHAGCF